MNPPESPANFVPVALPLPPLPPGVDGQPLVVDEDFPHLELPGGEYAQTWPPPRVWTVAVAFIVALLAGLIGGTLVLFIIVFAEHGGPFHDNEQVRSALLAGVRRPAVLLTSGAATQLMLLLTAVSAALLSPIPFRRRLRLNPSTVSFLGYLIVPVGAIALSFLFGLLVQLLHIPQNGSLKMLGDAFKHMTPIELLLGILVVGVAPGFAEEWLFRGYIQTRLVRRWGRWAGILITALLFGVMHLDRLQSPYAFGLGLYLGYLAEQAGSIRPGMICHAANNSLQVVIGYLAGGAATLAHQPEPGRGGVAIAAIIMAAISAACLLYINLRVHPPAKPPQRLPFDLPLPPPIPFPQPST